jgi:hypothetical protein
MTRSIANPTAVYRAIEATAVGGIITADNVVLAARDPSSVLHGLFPWNDAYAAHQYRLAIARSLIRQIEYVSIPPPPPTIRQITYVHDPRQAPRVQGYMPLRVASHNPQLSIEICLNEVDRVASAITRLRSVMFGLGVDCGDALDDLDEALDATRAAVTKPPKRKGRKAA